MRSVRTLHDLAMGHADEGERLRRSGQAEDALVAFRAAVELEAQAAWLLSDRTDAEPSRSVLFRSAASLALEVGDLQEAERLALAGLAGSPPGDVAGELRDVLARVEAGRRERLAACGARMRELLAQEQAAREALVAKMEPSRAPRYDAVWADLDHWRVVATTAREIDAKHRPGADMHDDDLVDVIVLALRDFPKLVEERDRLLEMVRRGL